MNEVIKIPAEAETIEVRLSPIKTPVAFNNKVKELVEECGLSEEEAKREVLNMTFVLEVIYEKNCGLFAVESDTLDCSKVWSPYTQKEIECEEN
jgi:hypothetical protein